MKSRQDWSHIGIQYLVNKNMSDMAECNEAGESYPADRMRHIVAAYFYLSARRINEKVCPTLK